MPQTCKILGHLFSCIRVNSANQGKIALTLLHSEWPKLHRVLAVLSAIGLRIKIFMFVEISMKLAL